MGPTCLGLSSLCEPEAQLCWLPEKLCQRLTSPSPHSAPSRVARALPVPGLQDDNHIRDEADLIRLGILEESRNPVADLAFELGVPASGRCEERR